MFGGHGYSTFSLLKNLYHDIDSANTGEGDNTILLQQTSKVLLKSFQKGRKWELIDMNFLFSPIKEPEQTKAGLNDVSNLRLFLQRFLFTHYEEVV